MELVPTSSSAPKKSVNAMPEMCTLCGLRFGEKTRATGLREVDNSDGHMFVL